MTRARLITSCIAMASLWGTTQRAVSTQTATATERTIPIMLTRDIDAARAHPGDLVTARTIQSVWVNGTYVKSGATAIGHVVGVRPFRFDPAPYAKQQPSILSIHFDRIESPLGAQTLSAGVRALAHPGDLREARAWQHWDEHDTVGYFVQIGGDSYRGDSDTVVSKEGDVTEYRRTDGIHARLLDNRSDTRGGRIECDSTNDEQPVAVFSASACGVFGVKDLYITDTVRADGSGTFRLESFHHSVKVFKGSAALLESTDRH